MLGLLWWLSSKELVCNVGDLGLILGLGRSSEEGNGNPIEYSCLGNPMVLLSLWHVHISVWDHFSELPLIFISVQAYWCQGL